MAAEGKKICFGFSKLKPSSNVLKPAAPCVPKSQENAKQFIDCLENQAIKVKNEVIQEKRELVIPLKPSITSLKSNRDKKKPQIDTSNIKTELSSTKGDDTSTTEPAIKIKEETIDNTLDAQARLEILESLSRVDSETEQKVFLLPLTVNDPKQVSTESSNEIDYESIPIEQFGMALIRGMGWKPDDSKNENKPMDVIQRPKGLGLGADKSAAQVTKSTLNPEDSQLTKNCCVKITGGMHINKYGKLESFNEDSGRVVVKLSLGNEHVTVIENLLVRVTQNDYDKNSRVINMQKYEKFKEQDSRSNREEIQEKRKRSNSNQEERQEKNRKNYGGSNNQNSTAQREECSRSRRETKDRRSLSSDDSNEIQFRQKYITPQSTSHKESRDIGERSIKSESSRQSKKHSRRESSASSMEEDKKSYRINHQDTYYRGKEKRQNKKQQHHYCSSDSQSSESSEDNRRKNKSKKHIHSSDSETSDKERKRKSKNEKRKRRKKSKRNSSSSETEAERKKKNKKQNKKAKHSY